MSSKNALRDQARELGFDACAVTDASPPASGPHLDRWLSSGHHGEMSYLARNAAKRRDPQLVLPGARSVVVVAASYHRSDQPSRGADEGEDRRGVVARYATHDDYHDLMGQRLAQLSTWMDQAFGATTRSLWYVDTGPVLERDLAQRAGLGFVGKHTNLVSRGLGNWFLIGEILTTLKLEPDAPEPNRCGRCVRCLQACPTGAIREPFQLDARLCISYLTIELKGAIPEALRPAIGDRIFGCDDCLAACPWNRFARDGALMRSIRREDLARPRLRDWLALTPDEFQRRFRGTPMHRTKRRGLLRNVCVALGNVGGMDDLPALERAAGDAEPLVVEHAIWAVHRIRSRAAAVTP